VRLLELNRQYAKAAKKIRIRNRSRRNGKKCEQRRFVAESGDSLRAESEAQVHFSLSLQFKLRLILFFLAFLASWR